MPTLMPRSERAMCAVKREAASNGVRPPLSRLKCCQLDQPRIQHGIAQSRRSREDTAEEHIAPVGANPGRHPSPTRPSTVRNGRLKMPMHRGAPVSGCRPDVGQQSEIAQTQVAPQPLQRAAGSKGAGTGNLHQPLGGTPELTHRETAIGLDACLVEARQRPGLRRLIDHGNGATDMHPCRVDLQRRLSQLPDQGLGIGLDRVLPAPPVRRGNITRNSPASLSACMTTSVGRRRRSASAARSASGGTKARATATGSEVTSGVIEEAALIGFSR